MVSRNHELLWAIKGFVIAGVCAGAAVVMPEKAGYFGAVAVGFGLAGAWSSYRTFEGRGKDRQSVADVRAGISALGKPQSTAQRQDAELLP